ncbi:MAG: DUF4012 domain-containing protein [Actinomycetota bacterium]
MSSPRHARRGRRRGTIVGLTIGLIIFAIFTAVPALRARSELVSARREILFASQALLEGNVETASAALSSAREYFENARSAVQNPALRLVSLLPILGRNPDAVLDIAEAGRLVATAGSQMFETIASAPEGLGGLTPRRGRFPVEELRRLAAPLERSRGLIEEATEILHDSPDSLLFGPVANAQDELETGLQRLSQAIRTADALAGALPSFLGDQETRRYFFGAQNPAELRGTGGVIGAFSIVTIKDGRPTFGPFLPTQVLRDANPREVDPPTPSYAERYDRFGGAATWLRLNMTPDFPSTAMAIEQLFERVTGERLDGVLLADPFALAGLLRVTGPAEVPALGVTVDASNVVPFVTNRAYAAFPATFGGQFDRKGVLGDVATGVVGRFLFGGARAAPQMTLRALADIARGGHLHLHSTNPGEQAAFEQAGAAGMLPSGDGDFLAVIANNLGANKLDVFAARTVSYDVQLRPNGTAAARATVDIRNQTPATGQPRYVVGPYPGISKKGESVTYLSVYCATTCRPSEPRDGVERELGHPVFASLERIPSGELSSSSYEWDVLEAWEGEPGGGTYRLTVHDQPTVRPTEVRIAVRVPDGMRITSATPEMEIARTQAVWSGVARGPLSFEVRFERSFWGRLADALFRFSGGRLVGPR